MIHLYVEVLDRYFGNVCELDIIFNFHKAYYILDEIFVGGELCESSKKEVLSVCAQMGDLYASAIGTCVLQLKEIKVQQLQARMRDAQEAFSSSWNWVDAYLRAEHGERWRRARWRLSPSKSWNRTAYCRWRNSSL